MGLFSGVKNFFGDVGKGFSNFSSNVLEPLGGGVLEMFGISGHGPKEWYADPTRTDQYRNSPATIGFGQQFIPGRQNPLVGGFANRMQQATAGLNPAARAAAGQRGRMQAGVGLAGAGADYYQRLMSLAQQTEQARQGIPTTSTTQAALGGFLSGGGMQGLTSLYQPQTAPTAAPWMNPDLQEALPWRS